MVPAGLALLARHDALKSFRVLVIATHRLGPTASAVRTALAAGSEAFVSCRPPSSRTPSIACPEYHNKVGAY